jgi:hypothetical protein
LACPWIRVPITLVDALAVVAAVPPAVPGIELVGRRNGAKLTWHTHQAVAEALYVELANVAFPSVPLLAQQQRQIQPEDEDKNSS